MDRLHAREALIVGCCRRSPSYNDRANVGGNDGPNHGTRVNGTVVTGADRIQYLRVAAGQYLPLAMPDGRQVLRQVVHRAPLTATEVLRGRYRPHRHRRHTEPTEMHLNLCHKRVHPCRYVILAIGGRL